MTSDQEGFCLDTVEKYIQNLVDKQPDQELFVFYKGEVRTAYTSRQLFELAAKFAHRLRHQYGLSQGDVVANTLPNSPERLITDLGITLAGCIGLNGQILLKDGEDFFLNARRSRAQAVVVNPKETSPAWRLIKPYVVDINSPQTAHLSCDRAPDLTTAITVSRDSAGSEQPFLEELENGNSELFVESGIKPEDTLYVFTTSGSTGYSKLVPRTHESAIDMWGRTVDRSDIITEQAVFYNDRPFGWAGGYPLTTYLTGMKRVQLDSFDMSGFRAGESMWYAITQERCTVAVILPLDLEHVTAYVKKSGGSDFKLQMLGCGGQPIKESQIKAMLSIANEAMLGYGSTEAGFLTQHNVKDASQYHDFLCGKLNKGISLRIIDDNNQECKPGQVGLILVKGKPVFSGYFNRQENPDPNTAKVFTEDGWFNTEDLGYFDEEGQLFVLGRNKDIIIYGSAVVYPVWLETRLMEHPDIVEAFVVPVSDPVLFHNICACIQPVPGVRLHEEDLKEFCNTLFIVDGETEGVPRPKFFLILKEFPETITGKPDKVRLKAMAEEKFGYKENDQ